MARNTAPACGLAAFIIERQNPDAVLGVFPSDHVIADEPRFLKALQKGIALAAAGDNMVVLGIEPTRAETGYGYIETGDFTPDDSALRVRRFTEKPNQIKPKSLSPPATTTGTPACFCGRRAPSPTRSASICPKPRRCWRRSPLASALRNSRSVSASSIPSAKTSPSTTRSSNRAPPRASTSPASICLPAEFSWNDLGSWASLYEYQVETRLRGDGDGNVAETDGHLTIEAGNNYIYSPKKFVALVGVENLVIVDTEDALLIAHRDHSQDVGKIVKELQMIRTELI